MADLSNLLAEISSSAPCGDNLEYDNARIALDTNIQGTPENQFSGEKSQPPNWRDVQKESLALLSKSKDLQVMLYLIRALIPLEGVKGFRDGMSFLEKSLASFWDGLHPQLDPSDGFDPTLRVNILEELASLELVLQPLSLAMLVESKSVGRFCLRDVQYATDKIPIPDNQTKPEINTIKAAFLDVELDELTATYQALNEAAESAGNIESFVAGKVGGTNGPNLDALKVFLKDVRHNFEQLAGPRLSPEELDQLEEGQDDGMAVDDAVRVGQSAKTFVAGAITSRRDVINALDSISKYYKVYEPSSPVPILLERAKFLVTADFMEVVKNMMPDALSQLELIKGPDSKESSENY